MKYSCVCMYDRTFCWSSLVGTGGVNFSHPDIVHVLGARLPLISVVVEKKKTFRSCECMRAHSSHCTRTCASLCSINMRMWKGAFPSACLAHTTTQTCHCTIVQQQLLRPLIRSKLHTTTATTHVCNMQANNIRACTCVKLMHPTRERVCALVPQVLGRTHTHTRPDHKHTPDRENCGNVCSLYPMFMV